MRTRTATTALATFGLLIGGLGALAGCEEGAFEEAGEEVDEALEDAGDAIEDAGDEVEDAFDDNERSE